MILVDSSVLIDRLRGRHNPKADIFDDVITRGIPFGISVFTYQEVLQGAGDEHEYRRLAVYLGSLDVRYPEDRGIYEKAARLYFDLRRRGVTIRSAFDLLIAVTAIEKNMPLLHSDRDFDAIAAARPELKILTELDLEQVPVMTEALTAYQAVTTTPEFKELERLRSRARHNEASALGNAEKRGERRGEARGIQKGRTEGRAEGEAKGRADVARAALREGMPVGTIARLTGLSPDEIRSLSL